MDEILKLAKDLTQSQLKKVISYSPDTGIFVWNIGRKAGFVAGSVDNVGYISMRINRKSYKAHRLAFLYMLGEFPCGDVDHINHDKLDNRWVNLRAASRSENMANVPSRRDNMSGYKGVVWHKPSNRWYASIGYKNKRMHLGSYKNLHEAANSYAEAAKKIHGEFSSLEKTTLNELEALARSATPGPWETNKEDIISNVMEVIANNGYISICDADPYDALFIAHANPQTILQMIALIRQLGDALKIWTYASDNSEESELDDIAKQWHRYAITSHAEEATKDALNALKEFEDGK